jgi:DNA mismatch endonuclease (patch repair protein)
MTDIYSKNKRSQIMSKISGKETEPEILVRKFLFRKGFRYRKNDKRYPGTPDIVLPKYKTVIFVHGCFWHGHNCRAGKLPETRKEFWQNKIDTNIARDKKNRQDLEKLGWKVKNKKIRAEKLKEIEQKIQNGYIT